MHSQRKLLNKALFLLLFAAVMVLSVTMRVSANGDDVGGSGKPQAHAAALKQTPLQPQALSTVQDGAGDTASENEYILGVDDVLSITVFNEGDLSGEYTISQTGKISMPLIGEIKVEGMTVSAAQDAIAALLSDGFLVSPSVAIEVRQRRPFYILGEVRTPGSYNYVSNMTVLNAVALAGGFTYRARESEVDVLRPSADGSGAYKPMPVESKVMPGDIILVKERFF